MDQISAATIHHVVIKESGYAAFSNLMGGGLFVDTRDMVVHIYREDGCVVSN